jgi:hypothetical protein
MIGIQAPITRFEKSAAVLYNEKEEEAEGAEEHEVIEVLKGKRKHRAGGASSTKMGGESEGTHTCPLP